MEEQLSSIQMTDFDLDTFESLASFPEIRLQARFSLLKLKQVKSIELQTIKEQLTRLIYENITQER